MEKELISHFLPKNLLLHFSITDLVELCDVKSRQSYFEIYLEENNEIMVAGIDASLYESKGLSEITIQDFVPAGVFTSNPPVIKSYRETPPKYIL